VTRFYCGVGQGASLMLCAVSIHKGFRGAAVASFVAAVILGFLAWSAARRLP
jgi:uncharacterized membrane protein YjjB (DUF3815 family)